MFVLLLVIDCRAHHISHKHAFARRDGAFAYDYTQEEDRTHERRGKFVDVWLSIWYGALYYSCC